MPLTLEILTEKLRLKFARWGNKDYLVLDFDSYANLQENHSKKSQRFSCRTTFYCNFTSIILFNGIFGQNVLWQFLQCLEKILSLNFSLGSADTRHDTRGFLYVQCLLNSNHRLHFLEFPTKSCWIRSNTWIQQQNWYLWKNWHPRHWHIGRIW